MDAWYVSYTRAMAAPDGLFVFVSDSSGCLLRVTCARLGVALPDACEIGEYRGALPDEELDLVRRQAASAIAASGEPQPLEPGSATLDFESGVMGRAAESRASVELREDLAPEVAAFDSTMQKLAAVLSEHPHAVLAAHASATAPAKDGPLEVLLTLEAKGEANFRTMHPRAAVAEGGLRLTVRRDAPEDELDAEDTAYLTLSAAEVTSVPAEKGESPSTLSWQSGDSLRLRLQPRRHLTLGRGAWNVSVSLDLVPVTVDPGAPRVHGTLVVPAGTVTAAQR